MTDFAGYELKWRRRESSQSMLQSKRTLLFVLTFLLTCGVPSAGIAFNACFWISPQEGTIVAKQVLRQVPIGTDRHHSRYWVFNQCVTPGLYVEKGKSSSQMLEVDKTEKSCH